MLMRWLEALGMDGRTVNNTKVVDDIAGAVDKARRRFSLLPFWIIGGAVVAWPLVP